MTRQAIIQMHNGVWQSFSLNSIAKSAHFYFQPTDKDSDTAIFYKTSDNNVRLLYRLYSGTYDTVDPT